ncbi:hypothetical protein Tco_0904640 [Tanacetum coccineum]
MSLQFPLLFVYGEDGYSKEMKMVCVPGASSNEDRRLTMKAYYSYMLHDRINSFNYLSKTGRLFQQNEYFFQVNYEPITRGDINGSDCDGRLILPQSFTEITEYMKDFPRLTTTGKADIVDRVFEMKIHEFVKYLRDVKPFEKIIAACEAMGLLGDDREWETTIEEASLTATPTEL